MTGAAKRHNWGDKVEFAHKSERECQNGCRTIKVTRHEGGRHWVEFWRDEERIPGDKTPPCEPVEVPA